jgi:hypothetical protein
MPQVGLILAAASYIAAAGERLVAMWRNKGTLGSAQACRYTLWNRLAAITSGARKAS